MRAVLYKAGDSKTSYNQQIKKIQTSVVRLVALAMAQL
jgi:hypothetical protein